MPDTIGKLDGLIDIVHPSAPVQTDYFVPGLFIMFVLLVIISTYFYKRYRRFRLTKARQYFHRLCRYKDSWSTNQCGDAVITILRLYAGTHHVQMQSFPGVDANQWSALMRDCNHLRFSTGSGSKDVLQGLIQQIEIMLWPQR